MPQTHLFYLLSFFAAPLSVSLPMHPFAPSPSTHIFFFKEMRYNLQGRNCLAFSDKALMAAQGELHGYTSPR